MSDDLMGRASYWLAHTDGATSIEEGITFDLIADLAAAIAALTAERDALDAALREIADWAPVDGLGLGYEGPRDVALAALAAVPEGGTADGPHT